MKLLAASTPYLSFSFGGRVYKVPLRPVRDGMFSPLSPKFCVFIETLCSHLGVFTCRHLAMRLFSFQNVVQVNSSRSLQANVTVCFGRWSTKVKYTTCGITPILPKRIIRSHQRLFHNIMLDLVKTPGVHGNNAILDPGSETIRCVNSRRGIDGGLQVAQSALL